MDYSVFRFTLNMHNHRSQASVSAFCGDTAIRLCFAIADGSNVYKIEDGCVAILSGTKADGKKLWNRCAIENNTIIYDFTKQTTSCVGIVNCEITLYGADGQFITAPKFIIVVDEREVSEYDVNISENESNAIDLMMSAAAIVLQNGSGAGIIVDRQLSNISVNPVQNKVITKALTDVINRIQALEHIVGIESDEPDEPEDTIEQIETPVVTISDSGIASWAEVEGANEYIIRIYDDTDVFLFIQKTTEYQMSDKQSIEVFATDTTRSYLMSYPSERKTYTYIAPDEPVTPDEIERLKTPVVNVFSEGIATWQAVPNAIKYQVLIWTGPITHANYETEELSVDLASYLNSEVTSLIINVKALGDGVNYKDSLFSAQQTYSVGGSLEQLAIPAVTIGLNTASWNSVPNALGYNYKINNGNEITTTNTSVSLNTGDSIIVKALGDAASYSDSEYSQIKYNIRLTIPVITISSTGLASWEPIENANNYYMVIRDGEDNIIKSENITSTEYQLTNKQSIQIFAMDKTDTYLMSFSSGSVRYNAPEGSSLVYYGVGTFEDEAITSDFITSLTSREQSSRACSFEVSPNNEYVYFAAPKDYCIEGGEYKIAFENYGIAAVFRGPFEVTINRVVYCVYRSKNLLTRSIKIDVK